ncbi:unnamed protein product [Rhizophagus irregularis]|uniref:Uncharacterized protein n=2 Tax=Rhizophagus irregularis TaxID=588596 RepID=A0A2I1FAV3_9GLOM|nr:hypothetical protein RhiirB3_449126 [Rhizophagus irregularis]CAB4488517.1 unnamed protein product [Rhizophagus irregularis]CAB5204871.1 unnamed protein product [Rhizophagus irregularis]CAB5307452.1 unnamed protein product [Rhizophagus irregularis]
MSSLGVCNINNKFCGCQTYMENDNNPGKCFYCNHFNAFHTGFSILFRNSSTPFLGACQKEGASCGCQAFFAVSNDRLKCKYCDHFSALHKMTFPNSVSSLSESINKKSVGIIRREGNKILTTGHPKSQSLTLNNILLFFKDSWKNKSAPRKNTSTWKKMKKRGLIIERVTFNKDDIKNFNTKIVSLFQIDIVANNIIILKGTKGEFKSSICQNKTLKNLRSNISKSNRKLYLALVDNSNDESSVMNIKNLIS